MRLYQLFYATALIAASLNLFGQIGIFIGCAIAGAWYYIFSEDGAKQRRNIFEVVVVATILILITCCLLPAVIEGRSGSRRMACANNVKSIALAMHAYESVWKKLPPAITYDAGGRPMHSWRVLLLPYLEEQRLYEKYSFDEPWDGPNNSKLLSQMPSTYRCPYLRDLPGDDFTCTYRILIGERTCFPPNGSRTFSEISDGLAGTLLVVESNQRVPWMAPVDSSLDEYLAEVKAWLPGKSPHHHSELLTHYDHGGNSSMADGSLRFLYAPMDKQVFEKLVYIDNGILTEKEFDSFGSYSGKTRIRWEGYLAISAFLFLSMLPAYWLFERTPNALDLTK